MSLKEDRERGTGTPATGLTVSLTSPSGLRKVGMHPADLVHIETERSYISLLKQ